MKNEFEYILLKKLLVDSTYFGKVVPLLETKYFQEIGNQQLFTLIKEYYGNYKAVPTLTELVASVRNVPNEDVRALIVSELQKINTTEEVKNLEFMLDETVTFVKDALYYESLILGGDYIQKKDEALKLKSKQLMEQMAKISIDTDLGLDFEDVEEMIKYYQEKLLGIQTQHISFNKRLGAGFLPGTLSVIMAASGIGKSLLMTDFVSGHIKEGKNVLLVSMEMMDKEIMKRVHANTLDLPINELRNMSPDKIRDAHGTAMRNGAGRFFVKDFPNGSFSALMLDQLLDSYRIEQGIEFDIVYLDYLGIMKSDLISPNAGLYSYVKSIVEEVRAVAKSRQIPIVSASQLNRSAVNNTDASNDAVSDSIGTVQTADFIVFLLQDEPMKNQNLITCKCTKNRFTGRTDTWSMNINYENMRFDDAPDTVIGMTEAQIGDTLNKIKIQDVATIQKCDAINEDDGFSSINTQTVEIDKASEEAEMRALLGV